MRTTRLIAGLLAGSVLAATPALAQRRASSTLNGKVLQVTPYAGYMRFGDFLDGPLGTSLSTANSAVYGGQLGLKLAPNVSLIGNLAYSKANLEVGVPFLGGLDVGESSLLVYDGGLQLDLPTSSLPVTPFVQGGVGAIRYDIRQSFLETQATNLAYNVGGGVDFPLGRTVGVRLMAKDYIGKFDFQDATGFDLDARTAHNWAFTAGLRLDF